ncbi:MAG: zf-HC2 domain-containing protein [Thermoanaerobaculia bacterium]|nr:zf-HC2 domain-containing protein [Thermoanaerobaculia bacterium]
MNCRDLECRLEALAAGSLPAAEERAHAEHLAGCAACRELVDLARLAEVPPDPGFTADVLRITLPFDVQIRRWWDALWPQLWHRPRFASEAAYVGLVVLVLAFATPGSPLAAVPAGALAIAQEPQLPRLELPAVAVAPAEAAAGWGNEARATADDTVQLIIEVRTRMGTFWDEAASLLETRDDAPSSTPEPVKETS